MFDRNNAADLLALKNEVLGNPGHYPSPESTTDVLDKLNTASLARVANTGVPALTLGQLWIIVASDSATATQFEFNISNLFAMSSQEGPLTDVSEYRATIVNELGDAQISADINALTRDLTMGETLFSNLDANGSNEVVLISSQDWFAARDS